VKGFFARLLSRLHRRIHDYEQREDEPRLGARGPGSLVRMPTMFHHPERVFMGRDSTIHPYCRIEVITENPHLEGPALPPRDARIQIGDRVVINSFTHFGAMSRIVLGDDVGIATGVCIEDHHYIYEGASDDKPLKKQPFTVADVVIEDGVMIGEHVTVLAGVTIGRNSWIGANAVVTKDIPAYSIAAGVPARVIRRMDASTGEWRAVDAEEPA
jgi:acetyltransferase-like isoleucine patch superfamily enzyme